MSDFTYVPAPGSALRKKPRKLEARFGDGYAAALGDARVVHLSDAGHWAWMDRPDIVDAVGAFLDGEALPVGFSEAAA